MAVRFVLTIAALASSLANGQTRVDLKDRAQFDSVFEQISGDPLKCEVHTVEPSVDFAFRFELRYTVECEIKQFGGVPGDLRAFLRVRPEAGEETVLGDAFAFPGAPEGFMVSDLSHVHARLEFSGVLAAGYGQYHMELLVVDNRHRVFRHHWKAKAFPHGRENELNFSMQPNTLAPLRSAPIPLRSGNNGGPLTVLINAAPLNPWSRKLRAWDRAFLLDSLSSLLRQLSYSSVRVVAFNLEQQQEIFRQDNFKEPDMRRLAQSLHNLELGSIAYNKLVHKFGWAELLLGLLKEETESGLRSNAVVFLGPSLRLEDKIPPELLANQKPTPPLFCVTYYPEIGVELSDSVHHLTTALKGKVFRIHSPSDLAQNLEKLQREIEGDASARTMRAVK